MKLQCAILLPPLLLALVVSARPSVSRRDLRISAGGHLDPFRRSTISERSSALSARQSNCLTTDCTSTSDAAGISAFNACSSTDTTCQCAALGSLSDNCLTCALSLENVNENTYNAECPTTNPCAAECSSAADMAAEQATNTCVPETLQNSCVCDALSSMSSGCLSCTLSASSLTETDFEQACGSPSASASQPPVTPTSTVAAPAATSTNPLVACEDSACSDSADLNYINLAAGCSSTDEGCFCSNIAALTSTCLTCVLTAIGTTESTFESGCVGYLTTSVPTLTSATTRTSTTRTSTAPASTTTNAIALCEQVSCTDSADIGYINAADVCPSTDAACFCNNILSLTLACQDCILAAIDTTTSAFQSECAAVLESTTTNTPKPTQPSPTHPTTTAPTITGPTPTKANGASHLHTFESASAGVLLLVGTVFALLF